MPGVDGGVFSVPRRHGIANGHVAHHGSSIAGKSAVRIFFFTCKPILIGSCSWSGYSGQSSGLQLCLYERICGKLLEEFTMWAVCNVRSTHTKFTLSLISLRVSLV